MKALENGMSKRSKRDDTVLWTEGQSSQEALAVDYVIMAGRVHAVVHECARGSQRRGCACTADAEGVPNAAAGPLWGADSVLQPCSVA